ncbi:MAG TPA: HEAT repeat domain-containing protein [Pirellulales bacterium]|jgi:HEAT repeat protein|nr:HEAT repeat domain-containing protein [Pirellulales bacterium]
MSADALNVAFDALKQYDWGTDTAVLAPIEDAVAAAHGDEKLRADLEARLTADLTSSISRDAKDYCCRKLTVIGTAGCVPALAALLDKPDHAHMARFVLERMPLPEAGKALRDAAGKLDGNLKLGVINSLGARRDGEAVEVIAAALQNNDPAVARAAALALGAIGTPQAAAALKAMVVSANGNKPYVIDGLLACAESLRGSKPAEARAIYESLAGDNQSRLVRLAATRGMLVCASVES